MKNFDLDAAKRGAAVCTRDGVEARIICFDGKTTNAGVPQPVIAEIIDRDTWVCRIFSYCNNGQYLPNIGCHEYDLMMRDDDYLEKLERGEYGNHIEDNLEMIETNEFEKHPRLAEYIRTMATTGHLPSDWSGFIAALNDGLASTTDREYWRRVYAGQIAGGLASHNGLNIIGSEIIVAKASCGIADALIEELEKTEKK